MTDDSERSPTPTDAAPPPSADDIATSPHASDAPLRGSTMPPGPDDAEAARVATMLPPNAIKLDAHGLVVNPQDMPSLLYNQLMKVHQAQNQSYADFFDANGRFAQMQRENRRELVTELTEALSPRVGKLEGTVTELQKRLADFELLFGSQVRDIKTAITAIMLQQGVDRAEPSAAPALAGKVLLVAEDNEALARIITRSAQREGAYVLTAASRKEAEKLLATRLPDLAVIDISLGNNDGIELATWLESKHGIRRSNVLLMTGHLEDHDAQRARRLRIRVLSKPFELTSLVEALKEAIVAQPAQPPG